MTATILMMIPTVDESDLYPLPIYMHYSTISTLAFDDIYYH